MSCFLRSIRTVLLVLIVGVFFEGIIVQEKSLAKYNSTSTQRNQKTQKVDQKNTTGSGSRSDCEQIFEKNSLTLLVPSEEIVHYTTLSNPSFYIYSSVNSPRTVWFYFVIPDFVEENPLVKIPVTISQPGFIEIKLPKGFKLENNKIYFWQIFINCKNDPERIDQVLQAAIKKIELSEDLAVELNSTDSVKKKAEIYQSAGIWYDVLNLVDKNENYREYNKYMDNLLKKTGVH